MSRKKLSWAGQTQWVCAWVQPMFKVVTDLPNRGAYNTHVGDALPKWLEPPTVRLRLHGERGVPFHVSIVWVERLNSSVSRSKTAVLI